MNKTGISYIALSLGFWIIVELLTAWNYRIGEWVGYMPWILLEYLLIILIFWFFLFPRNWSEKKVFFLMLVVMYLFEFLWQNPLLLNPASFVPASLLLASIWGFLTFVPLWIARKEFKRQFREHKFKVLFYFAWIIVALLFLLGVFSN